jgi:hypothetical protein
MYLVDFYVTFFFFFMGRIFYFSFVRFLRNFDSSSGVTVFIVEPPPPFLYVQRRQVEII